MALFVTKYLFAQFLSFMVWPLEGKKNPVCGFIYIYLDFMTFLTFLCYLLIKWIEFARSFRTRNSCTINHIFILIFRITLFCIHSNKQLSDIFVDSSTVFMLFHLLLLFNCSKWKYLCSFCSRM